MKYISTRGATARKQFSEVLLMGLAPDGGLMLPEQYPQIDRATLDQWRTLSYPELAFEVMSLFANPTSLLMIYATSSTAPTPKKYSVPKPLLRCAHFQTASKSKPCPMARLWHSKTWLCNSWAMRLNMY